MARSQSEIFAREFDIMMHERSAEFGLLESFHVERLALPQMSTCHTGELPAAMVRVLGVKEESFNTLNGMDVFLFGRATLMKRIPLTSTTFRCGPDGKPLCEQVPVPRECVAVVTPINIHLRNSRVAYGDKPLFRYVDYFDSKNMNMRLYVYILPRVHVFRLNLCALVLTRHKLRACFKGYKVALANGTYVHLGVVPYKTNWGASTQGTPDGLRVIGVKPSVNFDLEIQQVVQYWYMNGYTFDPSLTQLVEQVKGVSNLGISEYEGTHCVSDYILYSHSMQDEPSKSASWGS